MFTHIQEYSRSLEKRLPSLFNQLKELEDPRSFKSFVVKKQNLKNKLLSLINEENFTKFTAAHIWHFLNNTERTLDVKSAVHTKS